MANVYEIGILGRITWNLHSLNNEGSVGNVTEPRTIVLADGRQTDGISGEMLKHIHIQNMWELENDKSKFCDPCKLLKPERADQNQTVRSQGTPAEAIKQALNCELCDVHGFLIQKPTVARSSLVEFGWALGIPKINRDIHTHARHSVHEQELTIDEEKEIGAWDNNKCSEKDCETQQSESNLYRIGRKWYCEEHLPTRTGQMVYHRPTRSGVYAIISVFQPWRIGLNNVDYSNVIDDPKRKSRYELALKAYQAMFMRTEGSMTSTRLPHTENFEGIVVISRSKYPVPVLSPLKENYSEQIEKIKQNLGTNQIEIKKFGNMADFVKAMNELMNDSPDKLQI